LKDLWTVIAELGIELHPDRINILADEIKSIDSVEQFIGLKSAFTGISKNIVAELDVVWKKNMNVSPIEIASALRVASAAATANEKRGKTEIVWTGPSTGQIPVRNTEQVLCEVIDSAARHLYIVSFVAYEIDSVIKAMRNAIGRNVQIDLLLESSIDYGGHVNQNSIKMMQDIFPSANIYTWSARADANISEKIGTIHAKCAIADDELAFITSANLTPSAMGRNVEMGVLIRGGKTPYELQKHLESLITAKIFKKI